MSHTDRCIRSDGIWACAPGCTQEQNEDLIEELHEEARWADAAGYKNLAGLLRRAADRLSS